MEEFGFYKYRLSFDENEEWKVVDIRGRGFTPDVQVDISSQDLTIAPGRPINAAKVVDIKKQLPYIPRVFHGFYNNILPIDADSQSADSSVNEEEGEPEW